MSSPKEAPLLYKSNWTPLFITLAAFRNFFLRFFFSVDAKHFVLSFRRVPQHPVTVAVRNGPAPVEPWPQQRRAGHDGVRVRQAGIGLSVPGVLLRLVATHAGMCSMREGGEICVIFRQFPPPGVVVRCYEEGFMKLPQGSCFFLVMLGWVTTGGNSTCTQFGWIVLHVFGFFF